LYQTSSAQKLVNMRIVIEPKQQPINNVSCLLVFFVIDVLTASNRCLLVVVYSMRLPWSCTVRKMQYVYIGEG